MKLLSFVTPTYRCFLFLLCLTPTAKADNLISELEKKAEEIGDFQILTSKVTDPIGVEDLWGLQTSFIVRNSCQSSFERLSNIQQYPTYTKKVKKVQVLEKKENSLLVDYTEGVWGFETTSRLLWNFEPKSSPVSMTSKSVGEKNPPSWLNVRFHDAGHPNYCEIHIHMFADMSIVPQFIMNWISSMAAEELVTLYRDIINGSTDDQK